MFKQILKKILISLIIFFLIGTSGLENLSAINLKNHNNTKQNKVTIFEADIYVDDDADLLWYDETHVKTITEGITNSSEGNKIFVYNGTYYESVIVNKSVEISGEEKLSTTINGNNLGNVVQITAENVILSGFTIEKSSRKFRDNNSGIEINSNNNIISDNIITGNVRGILIYGGSNNQIIDNVISKNKRRLFSGGIYLLKANKNIISDNEISKNCLLGGIYLHKSNNNVITNNSIFKNKYTAISISDSSDIQISYNNIKRNLIGVKIEVDVVNNITISNNNFLFNFRQSTFQVKKFLSLKNTWDQNYWNRPRILPYRIFGTKYIFPLIKIPEILLVTFDWHPASKPYEI